MCDYILSLVLTSKQIKIYTKPFQSRNDWGCTTPRFIKEDAVENSNAYERSLKLQASVLGLVQQGSRSVGWLNRHFQRMLDQPKIAPGVLGQEAYDSTVDGWNAAFPGKGVEILEILARFCEGSGFGFKPYQLAKDFEERARRAIFWRQIEGVVRADVTSLGEYSILSSTRFLLPLFMDLNCHFRHVDPGGYQTWLGAFGLSQLLAVFAHLEREREQCLPDHAPEALARQLWWTIVTAIRLVIEDDNFDLMPFLDLWHTGNFPLGFDDNYGGHLVVLTAD